jgi:putative membrane protein
VKTLKQTPKRGLLHTLPFVSLLVATAALAQTSTTVTTPTATATASSAITPKPPSTLNSAERAFLEQAAQNGHAEVESGKLALRKSANTQVKSFAQQMVDDHGKTGRELAELAATKGVKVPDGPSLAQKGKIKLLSTADGERFDQRYAKGFGVGAHEDTIRLFEKAAEKATDPDVKAFATKTLPTLNNHLMMARDLRTQADRNAHAKSAPASR